MYRVVKKIAQSLMHHSFVIVGKKAMQFTPTCTEINTGNTKRTEFEYCN